jgi:predicted NBD/HSP70 family sugar kinase
MPYAEDFDAAANTLESAAQATGALVDPARATLASGVLVGGQLSDQVTEELDATATLLDHITEELRQLATTCRERAETCRQAATAQQAYHTAYTSYEADLRDWQHAVDVRTTNPGAANPGPAPYPPQPPETSPAWVNH